MGFATEPAFVWFYSFAIVLFAGYWAFRLLRRVLHLDRTLTDLTDAIEDYADEEAFAGGFSDYDKRVRDLLLDKVPWTEFVESLIGPGSGESSVIRNTRDVSEFLNDATIIFPRLSRDFYRALPNLLTGLGILGTFLGLAGGVGEASSGLGSSQLDEVTGSISSLLDGASLAFWTSIVGISCSIAFVLLDRWCTRRVRDTLRRWVDGIEERLERLTTSRIALDQLKQARRTTRELETFNTELVFSIQAALDEKIVGGLSPLLKDIHKAVDDLRRDRATDSATVVEDAVKSLASLLERQTGEQFEEMKETIAELNRSLAGGIESLRDGAQELARQLEDSGDRAAKRLDGSTSGLAAGAQNLSGLITQGERLVEKTATMIQGFSSVREEIITAENRFREAQAALVAAAEPLAATGRNLGKTGDRVVEATEQVGVAAKLIAETVTDLERTQRETSRAWAEYRERFAGLDVTLEGVFARLKEGLEAYSKQVGEFMLGLDGSASRVTDLLAGATQELSEAVEDLDGTLDKYLRPLRLRSQP